MTLRALKRRELFALLASAAVAPRELIEPQRGLTVARLMRAKTIMAANHVPGPYYVHITPALLRVLREKYGLRSLPEPFRVMEYLPRDYA